MTPHIEALKEEIAPIVLMPGDPLRAKHIVETYLTDYKLVSQVRNIFAYTGFYKNKRVTVMASGMGMPSIGIYAYELYKFYDVESIIRVGSIGAATKDLNLYDVILASESFTDSSFAKVYDDKNITLVESSEELNERILKVDKNIKVGRVYSTDVLYSPITYSEIYNKFGSLGAEMESFALFYIAKSLNKKAACLLTVSNNFVTKEETTSEERQKAFNKMIEIALESILE